MYIISFLIRNILWQKHCGGGEQFANGDILLGKKLIFNPIVCGKDSIPLCQETVLETLGRETFCRKMFVGKSIVQESFFRKTLVRETFFRKTFFRKTYCWENIVGNRFVGKHSCVETLFSEIFCSETFSCTLYSLCRKTFIRKFLTLQENVSPGKFVQECVFYWKSFLVKQFI